MFKKSNLDEMQEQKLLRIEHTGCWLAFWGLLVAILAQIVIFGADFSRMAGEWIVFMVLCAYLLAGCLRNGIWDRRLQPNRKTNLLASLIAGAVVLAVTFAAGYFRYHEALGALIAGAIGFVIAFAGCFLCLSLAARSYKKKYEALEAEPEEEEE